MSPRSACVCVIPARLGSTRLPRKPLALIGGKPMIRHVWERAREANVFHRVIVATDAPLLRDLVRAFGGNAVLTSPALKSGTDRVAAVARRHSAPLFVNLQGDEPFVSPRALAGLVAAMRHPSRPPMGTLATPARWRDIAGDPNAVKVAVDGSGHAVYFSRSPVPHAAPAARRARTLLRHLGVYAYRRDLLLRITRWPRSVLERRERLEQLRVFEYGIRPKVVVVRSPALSIDTRRDLTNAREWLSRRTRGRPGG